MYICIKDKACEDLDKGDDKGAKSSSSDYETDEEWEVHRQKQQAMFLKDEVRKLPRDCDVHDVLFSFHEQMLFCVLLSGVTFIDSFICFGKVFTDRRFNPRKITNRKIRLTMKHITCRLKKTSSCVLYLANQHVHV